MWIIVVAMISTGPATDYYAFNGYPFPDEIMCVAFVKKNYDLVTTIASLQYDGEEIDSVYCVQDFKLDELMNGKAV